ncbi:MAG: helix-turn-helix transcriptional regulator [Deltaproteobacteria bacterium]|nr:helix-turn-helix transcriptional regulator [Deltaproteobacteria bacterium]
MKVARSLGPAPQDLRRHVEGVWSYHNATNDWHDEVTPADEGTNLVVQLGPGRAPFLFLCGPEPTHRPIVAPPSSVWVGLRLRPGATRAILGVEGCELVGGLVPLADVMPRECRPLAERLAEGEEAAHVLLEVVRGRSRGARRSPEIERVSRAVALLSDDTTRGLDAVTHELGTSPRSFRREFGRLVGLGPKRFARVLRVRRAARHLSTTPNLLGLALDAGFSDHAHMTREFVALLGRAPSELRQAEMPFVPGAKGSVVDS